MVGKIIHFFKYNNAFTLGLLFLLLSTGTLYAANDDLRATVIASEQKMVAVDNSYIVDADLEDYEPKIRILDVVETDTIFTVIYRMSTIEIVDGVWVPTSNEHVLEVDKVVLGEADLGLYVAEELQEVANSQIAYLKEVQAIEQKLGDTERTVQTDYSGLVGSIFDAETASFPNYEPVIPEEKQPLSQDQETEDQKIAEEITEQADTTQEDEPDDDTQDVVQPDEETDNSEPEPSDTGTSTATSTATTEPEPIEAATTTQPMEDEVVEETTDSETIDQTASSETEVVADEIEDEVLPEPNEEVETATSS